MTDTFVQVPTDGTGKKLRSFSGVVGADTVHGQAFVLCDASMNIVDVLAIAPAGTEHAIVTRNIPSGTQTVDTELAAAAALADAEANPTVPSVGAKLSGYNGATWDRVGSDGGALDVMLGTPSTRQNVLLSTAAAGQAPTASDALLTLALSRNNAAAGGGATSNALSANKTFRIMSLSVTAAASTTTALRVVASLRFNSGGAVTTSSALLGTFVVNSPAAVANVGGTAIWEFGDGLDIAAGATPGQIGVSIIGSAATGLCWVAITGYEY